MQELAVRMRSVEAELVAGQLPVARLETVLKIIAEFEYTPWRIPAIVKDTLRDLLGML